ncbi:MAG: hypothetical protein IKF79_04700 [Methanosphaera sp.]|nr:hypothetical protein [Methanosphaera sp.]
MGLKLNYGFIIFGNLIIIFILSVLIYDKIYKLSIFNRNNKCYFIVSLDYLKECANNLSENDKKNKLIIIKNNGVKMLNRFYHVDKMGNITILNEKGRLIEQGIVIPLYLLLLTWPVLVIFHNNVMFLVVVTTLLLWIYNSIMIYLRYKFDQTIDLMNSKYPYKHSYITYMIFFNRLFLIESSFILLPVFATDNIYAVILLIYILFRLNYHIFIDKIDKYFNLNLLDKRKMDLKIYIQYILVMFTLSAMAFLMASGIRHLTF